MKYDHDEIIEKATTLFWQRGFQAAGMRDIQQALDMRPGSIYARFQSKEGLFKLVVEHYADNSAKRLKQVTEAQSPLDALYHFFETAL
ncbi:MAG: helix-turn-helix domain-containing protein, partial [Pseudomonadota bacterium]|nr:helix-turn-helix domain-containing protein [Pseudomonadota bacterium]